MKVYLYDTTLRDGTQGQDIAFTVEDKLKLTQKLDQLGIHYIEGGWPGSNPRDEAFFKSVRKLKLKTARLAAFGATRKAGGSAATDRNIRALLEAETEVVTIFGKSWDLHVIEAIKTDLEENLALIADSVSHLKKAGREVIYDAEHFFDGYRANPDYALKTLRAAQEAGADFLVLCDTNGGTLTDEIATVVRAIRTQVTAKLGIHCHNDSDVAVANSLAAVREGAVQIHGTINGIGERCGNANLCSVIANLKLKMKIDCLSAPQLESLREVAHFVDELANLVPRVNQPYVGDAAFAHKGGIHVSAVARNPLTYEHIAPETVGNHQRVLISDLSGQASILKKAREFGMNLKAGDPVVAKVVAQIKALEGKGFQFEAADASLEILLKKSVGLHRSFFKLLGFKVTDERKGGSSSIRAEAKVSIRVDGHKEKTKAVGAGPVNALDTALRKALERFYPQLKEVRLVDYKVRVLPSEKGTASLVRVLIESSDGHNTWITAGVSENIIEASWMALVDSIDYKLLKDVEKH